MTQSKRKKLELTTARAEGRRALDALRPLADALDASEVAPPPIPVAHLVAEALALADVAERTREALASVKLDLELLPRLSRGAHALAEAQAELTSLRGSKRGEAEIALEALAAELRSDMVADARFALRADRDAQRAIDEIQEGEGLDDLVQDLKSLAALTEKHSAPIEAVGASAKANAERARRCARELEAHVAARRTADREEVAARELRDRVATLLADAIGEVRAAGAYVFRKEPRTLAKFRSAYGAAKSARARARARTNAEGTAGEA